MTEYEWATTRNHIIDLFNGETPGAQLEQDIIGHFLNDPERTIRAAERIAEQRNIVSRWAVLRTDLERAAQANVTADNTRARSKQIERAKTWIDNAGCHYDLERHVEAKLFGDEFGPGIYPGHADQDTRDELIAYWREQRPRGEQAERDHIAYMEACKHSRAALAKKRQPEPEPEPEPDLEHAAADITFDP